MNDASRDPPATAVSDPHAAAVAEPMKPLAVGGVWMLWLLAVVAAIAMALSVSLWYRLSQIQESLARQSAQSTQAAVEARVLAQSAQESGKDLLARQTLMENKLNEVALQRGQLEDLIQSLSRSRDENLVVDVDSAIRLAQQQANLTGSLEPLLAALRSAEQRVSRSAQPRLTPLQRALAKDIDRIKLANVADTPSLLIKLDELVRMADEMPLANAVAASRIPSQSTAPTRVVGSEAPTSSGLLHAAPQWVKAMATAVREEARELVRVSRIDTPEAALLAPEQGFFARENLKLKLLNARLALLSRQFDSVRTDLNGASRLIASYFDGSSRAAQQSASMLAQIQTQVQRAEQPRIDDTLAALAAVAASATQGK